MDVASVPSLSSAHVGALQAVAAKVMETTNVETDAPRFARELILGFTTLCRRCGLDGVLQTLGLTDDADATEHPELRAALAKRLGTKGEFDSRGPRNAKPKQAADCVLAALGVSVVEDAMVPISLGGDVRDAVVAAFTKVLDRELGVPKVREDIIAWARTRCDEDHWPVFEKLSAALDERGVRMLNHPKVPLHIEQVIRAQLALARAHVMERAVAAAIDLATPILAAANPEAAARIDRPISLELTPRDVAIRRATEPQASTVPETVARNLLADLGELAHLAWLTQERAARPYSPSITFAVGDVLEHPKFGRGTVLGVSIKSVEVEFADSKVSLVHARK